MSSGAGGGGSLWLSRARLFLVSYAPLAFMFAARFWEPNLAVAVGFIAVGLFGLIDAVRLVRSSGRLASRRVVLASVEDQGGAVSGYLATYLLPFLGNLPQTPGDAIAYGLYFITALIIYVRSDQLALVNPTLYALGYRVSNVRVSERNKLIISRSALRVGDRVEVSDFMHVLVAREVVEEP